MTELRRVIQFDAESLDSILVLPFFLFFFGGGDLEKDILVTIPPSGYKIDEALTALTQLGCLLLGSFSNIQTDGRLNLVS